MKNTITPSCNMVKGKTKSFSARLIENNATGKMRK
jgi:hypothetical protein